MIKKFDAYITSGSLLLVTGKCDYSSKMRFARRHYEKKPETITLTRHLDRNGWFLLCWLTLRISEVSIVPRNYCIRLVHVVNINIRILYSWRSGLIVIINNLLLLKRAITIATFIHHWPDSDLPRHKYNLPFSGADCVRPTSENNAAAWAERNLWIQKMIENEMYGHWCFHNLFCVLFWIDCSIKNNQEGTFLSS